MLRRKGKMGHSLVEGRCRGLVLRKVDYHQHARKRTSGTDGKMDHIPVESSRGSRSGSAGGERPVR